MEQEIHFPMQECLCCSGGPLLSCPRSGFVYTRMDMEKLNRMKEEHNFNWRTNSDSDITDLERKYPY